MPWRAALALLRTATPPHPTSKKSRSRFLEVLCELRHVSVSLRNDLRIIRMRHALYFCYTAHSLLKRQQTISILVHFLDVSWAKLERRLKVLKWKAVYGDTPLPSCHKTRSTWQKLKYCQICFWKRILQNPSSQVCISARQCGHHAHHHVRHVRHDHTDHGHRRGHHRIPKQHKQLRQQHRDFFEAQETPWPSWPSWIWHLFWATRSNHCIRSVAWMVWCFMQQNLWDPVSISRGRQSHSPTPNEKCPLPFASSTLFNIPLPFWDGILNGHELATLFWYNTSTYKILQQPLSWRVWVTPKGLLSKQLDVVNEVPMKILKKCVAARLVATLQDK